MSNNYNEIYNQTNKQLNIVQTEEHKKAEFDITTTQFSAFAPPGFFGPLQIIQHHTGRTKMKISFRAESDAATVVGKVVYWLVNDYTELTFFDEITISTGNTMDSVKVAFKQLGVTGTPLTGTVTLLGS